MSFALGLYRMSAFLFSPEVKLIRREAVLLRNGAK